MTAALSRHYGGGGWLQADDRFRRIAAIGLFSYPRERPTTFYSGGLYGHQTSIPHLE